MRKYLVYVIFLLTFICSANSYSEETIRLTNGEWPPYTSEKLKYNGLLSHIVSSAFEEMEIKVEYEFFPWKRAMLYVENGEFSGSIAWSKNADREAIFDFSDPIGSSSIMFFHLKSYNFDWKTEDDLQGIDIGATLGYHKLKRLEALDVPGKNFHIFAFLTDLENLELLLKERIQIFACSKEVGINLIQSNFPPDVADRFTYHPKPFYSAPLRVIFRKNSKRSKQLIPLLNEGLKRLHENGKYNKIMEDFMNGEYSIKE